MTADKKIITKRVCAFCQSEENKLRKVGNFVVELTEITIQGERKLACQSCRVKCREGIDLRRQLTQEKFKEIGWLSRISSRF